MPQTLNPSKNSTVVFREYRMLKFRGTRRLVQVLGLRVLSTIGTDVRMAARQFDGVPMKCDPDTRNFRSPFAPSEPHRHSNGHSALF